jgi:hypothetical protein
MPVSLNATKIRRMKRVLGESFSGAKLFENDTFEST